MANHRIFIAINLPENIKKKLSDFEFKWPDLPARWVKKYNLHITLAFLGYLSDEEVVEICKIVKEAGGRHEPFLIKLNKIIYGPPKKTPPRMIWVEGEKSEELGELQKELENSLAGSLEIEEQESRSFSPHITLARIKQWEFNKIEPEERLEINEEINLEFEVNSIEVMESELKRGGPEYAILESVDLGSSV